MSEVTKPKWTISDSADWITIIDPGGEIFFEFLVDDDTRKVTEEKVAKMVHAMNQHDGLVAACERAFRWFDFCDKGTHFDVETQLKSALAGEPT